MKHAEDYYTSHMKLFEPWDCLGGGTVQLFPELYGHPWDDFALGILHTVNPTSIRVTEGEMKCDARIGRVTVYVNKEGIIQGIDQEVYFGLPPQYNDDEQTILHDRMNEVMNQRDF